jgi:hypothetical protein
MPSHLRDQEGIVDYLLERGLLNTASVVDHDLAVMDLSRRNRNFLVKQDAGACYFVKQEGEDPDPASPMLLATIGHEANVYRRLQALSDYRSLSWCLPRCVHYDPGGRLLVLEGFPNAVTLTDYEFRSDCPHVRIAARLGNALATLHRVAANKDWFGRLPGIPTTPPWVFFLDQPGYWTYRHSSAANLQFLEILQRSADPPLNVADVRAQWRPTTLIHGDMKGDNCIVALAAGRAVSIKVVDWELAQVGDPCWDVGSILAVYLVLWLFSIPITGLHAPDRFLALGRYPLARLQPAIRAFRRAYLRRHPVGRRELQTWSRRVAQFAGLRLLQTVYERLQHESSVTPSDVCALQLCANMIARPVEASVQLLGFPLPG